MYYIMLPFLQVSSSVDCGPAVLGIAWEKVCEYVMSMFYTVSILLALYIVLLYCVYLVEAHAIFILFHVSFILFYITEGSASQCLGTVPSCLCCSKSCLQTGVGIMTSGGICQGHFLMHIKRGCCRICNHVS